MLKKIIRGFLILATMFSLGMSAYATTTTKPAAYVGPDLKRLKKLFADTKRSSIRLLFLQQARGGSISANPKHPGCYNLKLHKIKPYVLYFSDQPRHLTGHISESEFMVLIQGNRHYYNIKPNVAIQGFIANGSKNPKEINYVAALTQPVYNARKKTITFLACPLSKSSMRPVKRLKTVNLFFDQYRPIPP